MKLVFKAIAAAVMASASMAGFAALNDSSSGANASVLWTIYDPASGVSYTKDLNTSISSMLTALNDGAATSISLASFSPDANLQSFLGSVSDQSQLYFNIVSAGKEGIPVVGEVLSSVATGAPAPTYINDQVKNMMGSTDQFVSAINSLAGALPAGGSVIAQPTDGYANLGGGFGTSFATKATGFSNAVSLIGGTGDFVLFSQSSALARNSTNPAVTTELGRFTVSFDNQSQSLQIAAAVPEPSTYAMLGLGLVALGIASRRRSAKR